MLKTNFYSRRKLTIKRNYIFESLFVLYLLMMGLLSGYFGIGRFWFSGLLFFIILLLINKPIYGQELLSSLFFNPSFYAAFILGCASIVLGSDRQYLAYNLEAWLKVLLVLLAIIILDSKSKYEFHSVLKSCFYLLNFFWIANLIIVSIQSTGNGFMMKQEWFAYNSLYLDHCSGFFGASGTHKLSIFAAFMTIYNLSFTEKEVFSSYRRKGMYVYILATDVWMLYISMFNDNKALFGLLPVWILVYYTMQATNENIKKIIIKFVKLLPNIFIFIVATTIFLQINTTLNSYVQDYIVDSLFHFVSLGQSGSRGSIERITIATDAIEAGYGLLFGKGLGAAAVSERLSGNFLGYKHFSMSSIGTMTTLGGIWFYLSVCLFYTHYFYRFIKLQKKSLARWLLCLLVLIGLTMYTPIFDAPVSMLWTCLTFAVIGNKDAASDVVVIKNEKYCINNSL